MKTIWRACGIALLGAFGFGSAYAVAGSATAAIPTTTSVTLPTVSLPTVSVPTLPTTTTVTVPPPPTTTTVTVPPLPTTTAVTVPPPTPTTTGVTLPPAPTLPPPVPPPAGSPPTTGSQPAGPSASATAPGSASGSASGAVAGSASGTGSGTAFVAGPSGPGTGQTAGPAARLAGFDLSRDRFRNRGKQRGATVVRFRLSHAARLVLVVRGPGPSCATVARIAIRGHAGANRYRFDGRVAGRPLEPGTYLLTPRLRGTTADLARAYVTIVGPGAQTAARILPDCDPVEPARGFLEREEGTAGTPLAAAPDDASPPPPDGGVRGEESPPFAALLPPRVFEDREPLPLVLGLAVLGLLAVSLFGIAFEVVRHLRSPQV